MALYGSAQDREAADGDTLMSTYAEALAASKKLRGATVMKLDNHCGYAVKVEGERGGRVREIDGVPVRYVVPKVLLSGIRTTKYLRHYGKSLGAE